MSKRIINTILDTDDRGRIFLGRVPADQRLELNLLTLRKAAKQDIPLIFVMAQYPYSRMRDALRGVGVADDENVFIDTITKKVGGDAGATSDNVMYLNSPHNLTNINTSISVAAERIGDRKSLLVVDSLSALRTYSTDRAIERFLADMHDRIKTVELNALLFQEHTEDELSGDILQHIDSVQFMETSMSEHATLTDVGETTARVDIPRYFLKALDWGEGDDLVITVSDGDKLQIKKK